MSRKSAREAAFKAIFEIPFHSAETPIDIISYNASLISDTTEQQNDKQYFINVTTACFDNIDQIDNHISSNLKTWTISRISKITLAILRLAMSEILFMDDIPYQVSINEAVELAKKFGDDDAPSFINGVLASVV